MQSVSPLRTAMAVVLALLVMIGVVPAAAAHPGHAQDAEFRALLFTKVAAGSYRHDSIPAGIAMIEQLATDHHFEVVTSDDSNQFNDANLATFDVVIMLQNGGMVWDTDAQRAAVQTYVNNGGGIVAIHNATDMNIESQFPWWDNFVLAGSHMTAHAVNGLTATSYQIDEVHESTKHLPDRWVKAEEWYNFKPSMRGKVHSLVEVDEKTYNAGPEAMGTDHPISWCRDAEGGRVWATGMGHNIADYTEPNFVAHILGGIRTAAGAVPADCSATVDGSFEKVTLDDTTHAPTSLDIAPDGRVFFTELLGEIRVYDPATGATSTALAKPVYSGGEDGMISVALAPDFATSNHIYVYYSPPGTAEINRLSRFTVQGNAITPSSEVTVLEVPASRTEEPGHTGGYIEFGPNGNLYLGVGDDVNPFQSSGYAPIDERNGRVLFDAQRTSANTNDLRGKILRIHPEPNGTYTIPAGNMFAPGTAKTRPEIYAMGFRNPFRFNVSSDGTLYLADYGPDAGGDNANRGPAGLVEWNVIKNPGNYGWPYCVGNNIPFNDYDFATGTSGAKFDCANPTNTSPNNTGLTTLPAARAADVWYGNGADGNKFPEMGGGGEAPMAGPRYEFDPNLVSDTKFPAYYDGKPFFYEWARNKFWTFSQDDNGGLLKIDPWYTSATPASPMDMKFGPDGAMYLVEWGIGYGRDNADSGVYRIDYTQGNRRPTAKAAATPSSGQAPLAVAFSGAGSSDPEGTALTYAWTFGDGGTGTGATPSHTYTANGVYNAQLTVTDTSGKSAVANVAVTVGNTAPTVTMANPVDGGFFDFGDDVAFNLDITDPEDGTPDCGRVVVQPALGHEAHAHPIDQINACSGQFPTVVDEGHADSDIFYSVDASYTDSGAGSLPPLVGRDVAVIQPKHKQAEFYGESSGVTAQSDAAAEAGKRVGDISNGDWIAYSPVNLHQIDHVTARVSAASAGGSIELRKDSPTGGLVATIPVPATTGYVTLPDVAVTDPGGTMKLVAVFRTTANNQFTVDSFTFIGKGVSVNAAPHVVVNAQPTSGTAPLDVAFTATAADPENNTPFTYAWNFGDGTTGSGASVNHTYAANGTFTASVTVTDSAGRTKTVTTPVVVRPAPMPPITCGVPNPTVPESDEFDSDRLDGCRWDAVVRPDLPTMHMSGGRLSIETQPGDINGGSNQNPRNFVLQNAPAGDWTVETRISAPLVEKYQLAGLMVYGNDDDYVKFDVVATNNAGSPPSLRAELVSENAAQFGNGGNRSIALGSPESGWWHLRLTKTGGNYVGEISDGGSEWVSLGEAVTNDVPSPKVGVMAIGPQQTNGPVTVDFDWFHLTASGTPPITCATPGTDVPPNDEFAGDRLDGCRWDAVVRPDLPSMQVADGKLGIKTLPGDINGTNNGDPRNFVLQTAPAGDWTVETRISAPLVEKYQLAGLMVYGNDDDYVKFDVVAVNNAGSAPSLRAELVAENAAQFGSGGNQSIALTAPSSGWWQLRLTKTGTSYTGEISGDGTTWTSVGAAVTNDVPSPKVGVMAIGPQQTSSVRVDFDWFRLRLPELPAITCGVPDPAISYSDEFDSDRLDGCRWDAVVRPDLPTIHMTGGRLSIDTQPGDINGTSNQNPRNFVLQNAPAGDWTVETRISAPLVEKYQLAGLMVYGNDDDYVKFDVVATNNPGSARTLRAELVSENAAQFGGGGNQSIALTAPSSGWWQLRLKKTGTNYTGEISGDGTTWTSLGAAVTNDVPSPKFGVMAIGPQQTAGSVQVDFDWFRVSGVDSTAPTVTAAATGSAGANGWWTAAPTVTITAQDDSSGVAATEYRVDNGTWTSYTAPFTVGGDGTHVVEYQARDVAGNVSAPGSLTVKVDAAAPTVTVSGLVDGASYGHSLDRVVGWQAADATSGVGSVSAKLDGAALTANQTVAMRNLALGTHQVVVTATDAAGLTRQVTVTFTVTTSVPDLRALVDRFAAERRITAETARTMREQLDTAAAHLAKNDRAKAIAKLEDFRKLATRKVTDVPVRDLLVGDAGAVITALRGN
ncbi:ThuA domain-containing protein [Actinokineospora sp. HUAS TT18]|uniref:ThuA domain-containing protein n=1 Tax=Actinokineospora sp. HUAS TT18 TaxID=3447451 RepID=UPI003F521AC0